MTGDCNCGCKSDCHDHGPRKVLTNEEKITHLKKYKEDLKKELSAVDKTINELSK